MSSTARSPLTLAAYAAPCLPLAGLGLPLIVYLPAHYATDLGLSLSAVGAAFMIVRLLDIAFDPFIGGVMDATRFRYGRFRLWLVISVPLLCLSTWMLFMARPGVGVSYLVIWLLVIYAGFSIASLAQIAWGSVLSPDYDQRSRIYAWWQSGNVAGMILVLTLPALLPHFGFTGHSAGVAAMGWFVVILTPLTVAIAVLKVPEPERSAAPHKASLGAYFALMRRPAVVRLLAADFLIGAGPAITGALFFFFFEQAKGFDRATSSLLLLFYFIGGLVGAPLWAWLAARFGKHRSLAMAAGAYAVFSLGALIVPPGAAVIGGVVMFLIGLPYAAGPFLLRAMMADAGDEVLLETRNDRTGLLYALLAGTVKIGSAVAVGIAFPLLEFVGFDPRGGGEGIAGLQGLFVGLPALLSVAAGAIILGFPITPARHADIRRRLEAMDAASESADHAAATAKGLHVRHAD